MKRLWVRMGLAFSAYVITLFVVPAILIGLAFMFNSHEIGEFEAFSDEFNRPLFNLWIIPIGLSRMLIPIGLFGMGAGFWVARGISRPITQLSDAARRVGAGELGLSINVKTRSAEIADLANAFNKMSADLERAEQMRSQLMADVSHELRTPLTVLEGNLRAALDKVYELDDAELANLYGQTRHLTRLVNDLRELSLAESNRLPLEFTDIDVSAIVREVAGNLSFAAEAQGVALTVSTPDDMPLLHADGMRLRQVISNLVVNAMRHTPRGGKVKLRVGASEKSVAILVEDTGEGIAAEHLPMIFERFYRVDKSRTRETGGTGLGLAIVQAIVQAHGGKISAESPGPNQGTIFTIKLPRNIRSA